MPNYSEESCLSAYDYELPERLIATEPKEPREQAKLLFFRRNGNRILDRQIFHLPELLPKNSLLIINDTKVRPSRILAKRKTGGNSELLLIHNPNNRHWNCKILNSKKLKMGEEFFLFDGKATAKLLSKNSDGTFEIRVNSETPFAELLREKALAPIPPYIRKKRTLGENEYRKKDLINYQTVFAKEEGAIAAPTAGLHFTEKLIFETKQKNIEFATVTLHVGIGTFEPIKTENILKHRMHEEEFKINEETALKINRAKAEGRKIIAVGTTTARALESSVNDKNQCIPTHKKTGIFIHPGYRFRLVDGMMTNFHLPKSSLLILVSAFCGRNSIFEIYHHAIEKNYRFYSYGDACFLL